MLSDCNGELADFFNWRPPSLYPSLTASRSKGTRDPSFYDKLLAENLILRRVRNLPSLPMDIAGTVDRALNSISDRGIKLPTYSEKFPTESVQSFVLQTRPSAMQSETVCSRVLCTHNGRFLFKCCFSACITTYASKPSRLAECFMLDCHAEQNWVAPDYSHGFSQV
jgi:hypothetical protein